MPRLAVLTSLLFFFVIPALAQQPAPIVIDTSAASHPLPHFWEEAFGSGRAILSLRESYRNDLREIKKATDLQYVRFHAILHDEVGVYDEDQSGKPEYNFTYVGQIYDGLLDNGVRPIVEISFMPRKLALRQDVHPFWYKQIVSPPKDYAKWDDLIRAFGHFLVDRYGIDEVSKWYFEVWNEPNIDFWSGEPKQSTYFELYDHTARALKSVSPRLRVGGPSTAAAHWIPEFIAHTSQQNVPLDFVSTHGYADDTVADMLGTDEKIPFEYRLCRGVQKVHHEIESSSKSNLPLLWTEWSFSDYARYHMRDASYAAPAIAETIRACDGSVNVMSFWTFTDVFEENGPIPSPFIGAFGTIAVGGIKKPSFYAFSLLHKLGTTRLDNSSQDVLVTRREDGTLVVAVWNLSAPDAPGAERNYDLTFRGLAPSSTVLISRIDAQHGNPLPTYEKMGRPPYPTEAQVREMNRDSALPAPESAHLDGGHLRLTVPVNGLALLEFPH